MLFRHIGETLRDQPLDDAAHLVEMFGGARLGGRLKAAERRHIGLKLCVGAFRDAADRLVQRKIGEIPCGAIVDLVINVRDVAGVGNVLRAIEMPQQAEQHVEDDDRARVADMGEVVDRRPADIHAHVRGIERNEGFLLPRQRIVELELRHRPNPQKS